MALSLSSAPCFAKGIKATFAPERVSLDGVPDELDGEWRALDAGVKGGGPADGDIAAKVLLAYAADGLWIGADVSDDQLVGGADHLELVLGIPGGTVWKAELYPGVPGKSRAEVKSAGRAVSGAKIVEAPSERGYTLEAKIPWSAVPKSSTVRIGYRGAMLFHDADASRSVEQIIGTSASTRYQDLPPISLPAELALGSGLLRERNIRTPPTHNLLANVVGDGLLERVLVYDRFLIILGMGYRGGAQFYYRDLEADADEGDLLRFEVKDFTGDGLSDVLVKKRIRGPRGQLEALEILSYHPGDETPAAVFSQELSLAFSDGGKIDNRISVNGSGRSTRIVLEPGTSQGIDQGAFERVSNTGANPVLLPWGDVAKQIYTVDGGTFVLSDEETKATPIASAPRAEPASVPLEVSNDTVVVREKRDPPDVAKVYAHYKKQRNITGKPRFDLDADVAEGRERERIVVHGLDVVVMGEGFLRGRGFAAVELSHFARGSDVTKVETRDVTGDGKHEIIVRGVIRSPLPEDVGDGDMKREVILIFQLKSGSFERIFAAELARAVGDKRVEARLALASRAIELRPGRAVGYDESSYPWRQRKDPDGGFEPLLLPWGGIDAIELRYDGEKFVR